MLNNLTRNLVKVKVNSGGLETISGLLRDVGLTHVPGQFGTLLPPLIKAGLTGSEIRNELIMAEARLRIGVPSRNVPRGTPAEKSNRM